MSVGVQSFSFVRNPLNGVLPLMLDVHHKLHNDSPVSNYNFPQVK